MKYIYHFLLIFLVIFAPKIPFIYNGAFLAGIVSGVDIMLNPRSKKRLLFLLRYKYTFYMVLWPLFLTVVSLFIVSLHGTYDLSILRTFIGQALYFVIVILVFSVVYNRNHPDEYYVHKLIFSVFAVQTIIILVAFLSPRFLNFVQLFQSSYIVAHSDSRFGIRTLMLATTAYFGLGLAYGFVFIIYFRSILVEKKKSFVAILMIGLFFVGTLFVARTGLVGFVIGIGFFFFSKNKMRRKLSFLINSLIFVAFFAVLIYIIVPSAITKKFNKEVAPFAFSMFMRQDFQTHSTNQLIQMWHVEIEPGTYLVGTGHYMNHDGSYYKHTDVGYIRNILFGGVGFFLILLIYQIYMLSIPLRRSLSQGNKDDWFFFLTIIGYLLITHAKGQVLGFSKTLMITLFFYLLPIFYYNKKRENIADNK